jgi:5-methylcytosine-specific restriction endonuclease McrA
MAHLVSRGRGGKDELSNVVTKCYDCHMVKEHSYGPSGVKPCPKKEQRGYIDVQNRIIAEGWNDGEVSS